MLSIYLPLSLLELCMDGPAMSFLRIIPENGKKKKKNHCYAIGRSNHCNTYSRLLVQFDLVKFNFVLY